MSFYGLIDNEEESIDLPWFNEFLELEGRSIDGQVYVVDVVKSTPKGFILTSETFNAWVWRKTALGLHLQATLTNSTQAETHPCLAIMVNLKIKNKFSIGLLDDVSCSFIWNLESNTYTLHPQKNLPLELPPNTNESFEPQSPTGNGQKPSSVPRKASVTSSKVESSQKIAS